MTILAVVWSLQWPPNSCPFQRLSSPRTSKRSLRIDVTYRASRIVKWTMANTPRHKSMPMRYANCFHHTDASKSCRCGSKRIFGLSNKKGWTVNYRWQPSIWANWCQFPQPSTKAGFTAKSSGRVWASSEEFVGWLAILQSKQHVSRIVSPRQPYMS